VNRRSSFAFRIPCSLLQRGRARTDKIFWLGKDIAENTFFTQKGRNLDFFVNLFLI
jgi:hypothetical protein